LERGRGERCTECVEIDHNAMSPYVKHYGHIYLVIGARIFAGANWEVDITLGLKPALVASILKKASAAQPRSFKAPQFGPHQKTSKETTMINKSQQKRLRRLAKRLFANCVDPLAEKQVLKDCITESTENGRIAIVRRGHDCDHMHYRTVRCELAPVSLMAFIKAEDEHRAYLDGPEAMSICRPSEVEEGYEYHDLAAEMSGY
jgi:hypothetical protein